MATRPDQSHVLAAKHAKSPDVAALFRKLALRAEDYALMQDQFLEGIIQHREARTGKPFRYTKRQEQMLEGFDKDAAQAECDLERITAGMDDRSLLTSALSSEYQQLQFDEGMATSYPPEDKEMAQLMIEFRRETVRIIEQFVQNSPFRRQVHSIGHGKKKSKAV